jgi:anti-sigma-K factor RskA
MPLPPHGAAVAITIEPAGGSRQPTSQPIVVLSPSRV